MSHKPAFFFLLSLFLSPFSFFSLAQVPREISPIEAPFTMPQLERPAFPDRELSIVRTGARPEVLSTKAIQRAIDRLSGHGGGTVIVPAGSWLTGRLELKSNVCLRLDEGACLRFSGDIADYLPVVPTRNEGVDVYSLGAMIYAYKSENIGLTGSGTLVSPAYDCEVSLKAMGGVSADLENTPLEARIFDGTTNEDGRVFMPTFFGPVECRNVLVEGVTFNGSIFWNIAPTYCENVIIRGVTVNSYGRGRTDGIDIDSSVNVLIEYVTLDCGDDTFTLKAGRGMDGLLRNRPTENVVIRYCTGLRGVGGITIGSETAGMIRHVYAHDCEFQQVKYPFYFKTRRPRGGGAEDIYYERIHVVSCRREAITMDMLGNPAWVGPSAERLPAPAVGALTPVFKDIHLSDITVDQCTSLIRAVGLPEQPVEGLTLINVRVPNNSMSLQDVSLISVQNE